MRLYEISSDFWKRKLLERKEDIVNELTKTIELGYMSGLDELDNGLLEVIEWVCECLFRDDKEKQKHFLEELEGCLPSSDWIIEHYIENGPNDVMYDDKTLYKKSNNKED